MILSHRRARSRLQSRQDAQPFPNPYRRMFSRFFYGCVRGSSPRRNHLAGRVHRRKCPMPSRRTAIMPRVGFAGVLFSLSGVLWIGVGEPAHAQDRAGAAGMVAQAPPVPGPGALPPPRQPPLPPPGGGVIPPPGGVRGGGGGVVNPPLVGNLGIGAIPVMPPPPIGYYAPARTVDYNVG